MADHIFKEDEQGNLKFVGDFDALYLEDADPWGQSGGEYYAISREGVAMTIKELADPWPARGLEIGCGLGHSTYELEIMAGGYWAGCDISMEAIKKARANYPATKFFPVDIGLDRWPFLGSEREAYHVVVWSHIVWYVLHNIDHAVMNSLALLKPGGLLVVSQAIMRGEQRYGREIANGFEGIVARLAPLARECGAHMQIAAFADDTPVYDNGLIVFKKAGERR